MMDIAKSFKSILFVESKSFLSFRIVIVFFIHFFITKKNINAALDAALRAALGILNENDISSDEIFKKFKKFAKKLNRVSAKASNMSEVYSEEERNKIGELNEKLIKLTGDMGSKSKDVATIKASLKEFLVTAQAVGKIVESKK